MSAAPQIAHADTNDLALNRLTFFDGAAVGAPEPAFQFRGGCGTMAANYAQCFADNTAFANLANELGGALAPGLLAPAATIGYNRVYIAYEHSITNINAGSSLRHWQRGTEGIAASSQGNGTERSRTRVPEVLFASRLHMRHGLPYGFELGAQGTYLHDSGLVAMGVDIKWAPFEGFRTGVGYIPDIAIRGAVNTLVGNQQLYLTVVSIDALISKAITVAGSFSITPYAGLQSLLVFGDSTVIDGTPTRSSSQECSRRDTVYSTDPMTGQTTSSLVCVAGTGTPAGASSDSFNDVVFLPTRLLRWRPFGGFRIKYGVFTFTSEFIMDATSPTALAGGCGGSGSVPAYCVSGRPRASNDATRDAVQIDPNFRQFSVNFGVGVTF
ncbi:MAG: hypothetical protein Q8Q09_27775 [Deltaproteobacteria bacterium]|nr:hypothetical protein [Deltaproteobacteria bacterium]